MSWVRWAGWVPAGGGQGFRESRSLFSLIERKRQKRQNLVVRRGERHLGSVGRSLVGECLRGADGFWREWKYVQVSG